MIKLQGNPVHPVNPVFKFIILLTKISSHTHFLLIDFFGELDRMNRIDRIQLLGNPVHPVNPVKIFS